ncbi:MAG: SCO family protein [Myxococcaceae bacterium]|nr:SCO family protein [Myxococcaceae bacterium]
MKLEHGALLVVILFGATVVGMGYMVTRTHDRRTTAAERLAHQGESRKLEPLWAAPDFDLPDQRGGRVSKASLQGRPWVVNFIFTTCKSVCPLLTAKMVQLQRRLTEANVHFVSVSVDPAHDDVMTLGAYAQKWAPAEKRWSLLATRPDSLAAVLEGFKVTAEAADSGVDPIVHSSIFVLVDAAGVVRGVYDSEHREEFLALARDAALLAKAGAPPAPPRARTGEELWAQLSCAPCHDSPSLAPPLGGLFGKKVELDNGLVVEADEGYLLESILVPDAKRVRGYPLRMPTYDGVIESADLVTLLAYVKGLKETGPRVAPQTAVDPVCGMEVMIDPQALSAEADGGSSGSSRVFFCSESCRDQYLGHR